MSTVHDVARIAGVSIATVSRVFGHPDAVATATRRRVLAAADELALAAEMARHVDGLLLYPSQPPDDAFHDAVAGLGPVVVMTWTSGSPPR